MEQTEKYYRLLGLEPGSSLDDIKKAYRSCARKYHPDINKSDDATEIFILSTEAYQYLVSHHKRVIENRSRAYDFDRDWEKHRREQARKRAHAHAQKNYQNFVNSDLYKSTRILEKTRLYISIAVSVLIISLSVYGYIDRLRLADLGYEEPTIAGFIMLLLIGILFLSVSLLFLYHNHFKNRKTSHAKKNH